MNNKQISILFLTIAQLLSVANSAEAAAQADSGHTGYLADMSLGCVADLSNYYFNLKGLTKEINP